MQRSAVLLFVAALASLSWSCSANGLAGVAADSQQRLALSGSSTGRIQRFPLPPNQFPWGITAGADGALWFTVPNPSANAVGRMTTAGLVTEMSLPTAFSSPDVIVSGPDGNLWFTENTHKSIGRMSVTGSLTEFPTSQGTPFFITRGPDGNLWFTGDTINFNTAAVSRITLNGMVSDFADSTPSARLFGITRGKDCNVWFLDNANNLVGKSDRTGHMSFFSIPTSHSSPYAITSGPDGNLWFTESVGNKIGRITPQGVLTEFPLPSAIRSPEGIAAGPDRNLWFTEVGHIGRISTAGIITEFSAAPLVRPFLIAQGPPGDQHMWFTDSFGGAIGSIHI